MIRTTMKGEWEVRQRHGQHVGGLPPIVLACSAGPITARDYFTPEQARELGLA